MADEPLDPHARPGRSEEPGRSESSGRSEASGRPEEIDVDRGFLVGVASGLTMFFLFQGAICGLMQSGVVSDEVAPLAPLRFAFFTQLIYVFPTMLFYVNRQTPRMAKGYLVVAAVVFVGSAVSLLL